MRWVDREKINLFKISEPQFANLQERYHHTFFSGLFVRQNEIMCLDAVSAQHGIGAPHTSIPFVS